MEKREFRGVEVMEKQWRCPQCETLNQGNTCSVCGYALSQLHTDGARSEKETFAENAGQDEYEQFIKGAQYQNDVQNRSSAQYQNGVQYRNDVQYPNGGKYQEDVQHGDISQYQDNTQNQYRMYKDQILQGQKKKDTANNTSAMDSKPSFAAKMKSNSEQEVKAESKPKPEVKPKPTAKTKSKPRPESKLKATSKTEPKPKSTAKLELNPKPTPKSEPKPEPTPKPEPKSKETAKATKKVKNPIKVVVGVYFVFLILLVPAAILPNLRFLKLMIDHWISPGKWFNADKALYEVGFTVYVLLGLLWLQSLIQGLKGQKKLKISAS